jgi:hypothetical protein
MLSKTRMNNRSERHPQQIAADLLYAAQNATGATSAHNTALNRLAQGVMALEVGVRVAPEALRLARRYPLVTTLVIAAVALTISHSRNERGSTDLASPPRGLSVVG